jgi:aquaporin Z
MSSAWNNAARQVPAAHRGLGARLGEALQRHWPEYLIEGALLGLFMVAAAAFGTILEHPSSALHRAIPLPIARRILMGLAMGTTAAALIYSPWGRRAGAHMNPSVTLTFLRLGKIDAADAFFYVAAQFAGGAAGVLLARLAIGPGLGHPAVRYVATLPGPGGAIPAFAAEIAISFVMMSVVLGASNSRALAPLTGLFAGGLVATWITLEAPLSGMSMNPARTLGSAIPAAAFAPLWIYFLAPPLGMLLAAEGHRAWKGAHAVRCAKLQHDTTQRCIFRCGYHE